MAEYHIPTPITQIKIEITDLFEDPVMEMFKNATPEQREAFKKICKAIGNYSAKGAEAIRHGHNDRGKSPANIPSDARPYVGDGVLETTNVGLTYLAFLAGVEYEPATYVSTEYRDTPAIS